MSEINTENVKTTETNTPEINTPEVSSQEVSTPEENKSSWVKQHVLNPLSKYLKNIWYDIRRSIKENPNIIWCLLLGLPGVFIGLFLTEHINAAKPLTSEFSMSGFEIFVMELAGCLNMVWGFNVMKKKNLKSCIFAAVTTAIIVVCGTLWITNFFRCEGFFSSENSDFHGAAIMSIVCIAVSIISPLIGAIGCFFTRNKNYTKETL